MLAAAAAGSTVFTGEPLRHNNGSPIAVFPRVIPLGDPKEIFGGDPKEIFSKYCSCMLLFRPFTYGEKGSCWTYTYRMCVYVCESPNVVRQCCRSRPAEKSLPIAQKGARRPLFLATLRDFFRTRQHCQRAVNIRRLVR